MLVHKVGEKESEVDVDYIYSALRERMIKVLARETNLPESEFQGDSAIKLMSQIEDLVSYRVFEIKKIQNESQAKYDTLAKAQRELFFKEKRIIDGKNEEI